MLFFATMLLLLLVISNVLLPTVQCSDQFEVLRFSNVPFPSSSSYAAHLNGTFHTGLNEFTVCVRFLIESYNEGALGLFKVLGETTYVTNVLEDISNGLGWGTRGFQGGVINFFIGIPDGGMINKRFPINHHFNAANNIETSTWNHLCTSYSSKINRIHMFQDGLKVFSYQYKDPHDIPMPANTFGDTRIGWNMRGLISDINIHSTFFDEDSMRSLTLSCGEMQGDIFKWDASKVNITQDSDSQLEVTIETMDKSEICLPNSKLPTAQEPKNRQEFPIRKGTNSLQNSMRHLLIMCLKLSLILLKSQTRKLWTGACDSMEKSCQFHKLRKRRNFLTKPSGIT